jgi:hypothetical protein
MRRPVSVKSIFFFCRFFFFLPGGGFFRLSRAASVATLPSALFVERLSLGASWVYSIQEVLLPDYRPLFPPWEGNWSRYCRSHLISAVELGCFHTISLLSFFAPSSFFLPFPVFHREISSQDRLGTMIANSVDP